MLDEQYFLSSFLSGLNDELRPMVKMLQPTTIRQAAEKARLHELSLEAFTRKHTLTKRVWSGVAGLGRGEFEGWQFPNAKGKLPTKGPECS